MSEIDRLLIHELYLKSRISELRSMRNGTQYNVLAVNDAIQDLLEQQSKNLNRIQELTNR